MRSVLVVGFLTLLAHAVFAQERNLTITLPASQMQYIAGVVGKRPYEESSLVLNSIQDQINAQINREANAARDAVAAAAREAAINEMKSKAQPTEESK